MFRVTVCLWYYEILTVWIRISYAQKLANKVFDLQTLNRLLLREHSVIHTFIFHLISHGATATSGTDQNNNDFFVFCMYIKQ